MKFSALYQSHDAMREPCFRMEIDGKTLENTPGARLLRIECELTSNRQAGMLCLKAALNPKDGHGAAAPQHRREAPVKGGFGVATPTSIRPGGQMSGAKFGPRVDTCSHVTGRHRQTGICKQPLYEYVF